MQKLFLASMVSLASLFSIYGQNQTTLVLAQYPYITMEAPNNAEKIIVDGDDDFEKNFQAFSIDVDPSTAFTIFALPSHLLGLPSDIKTVKEFYNTVNMAVAQEQSFLREDLRSVLEVVPVQNPNIKFCLKSKSVGYEWSYNLKENGEVGCEEIFFKASIVSYIALTNQNNIIFITAQSLGDFASAEDCLSYKMSEANLLLFNQLLETLSEK